MIEPEHVRIQVALQVLGADYMVYAVNPSLGVAPEAFDVVRVGIPCNVLLGGMEYRFVGISQAGKAIVCGVLIGIDGSALDNVGLDHRENRNGPVVGLNLHHGVAFPFHHADYCSLAYISPARVEFLGFMLIAFLATHIGFVNLDFAKELEAPVLGHEFANLVEHPPCRLVGNAGFSLKLLGGNAGSGRGHEEHSVEPCPQGSAGLVEYRIGARGDMRGTSDTGINLAGLNPAMGGNFPALLAVNAGGPAQILQVFEASVFIREHLVELLQRVLFHMFKVAESSCVVKG